MQNGGTLFLDEIGEMPLDMQAKLLRVLETRTFCRLGGSKKVKINVRVLAAHLPYEIAGHIESNGTDQADPWEQWLHLRPLGQMSLAEVTERVDNILCAGPWKQRNITALVLLNCLA